MASEKPLLQHLFKQGNVEYYTHQPRDEKSYRVVIKNLLATISTDDTRDELQNIGFKIRNVVTFEHRKQVNYCTLLHRSETRRE